MLASKHRQIGGKKGSVNLVKENRGLLNENESQNSNSYGQLPPADLGGKDSLRGHRGSQQPRVISRVRGDKGMQVYANQGSKQSVQLLYGGQRSNE